MGPDLKLSIPAEATVARGTILNSSCDKSGLSISFRADTPNAPILKLTATGGFESGFSDTLWVGEDHYTPCFHLGGLPAVVGYQAAGDGGAKPQGAGSSRRLAGVEPSCGDSYG